MFYKMELSPMILKLLVKKYSVSRRLKILLFFLIMTKKILLNFIRVSDFA